MAKTSPVEFVQEVREEARKITWPTRKEVMISTVMVMIMVSLRLGILPGGGLPF